MTEETASGITSLRCEKAPPQPLLALIHGYRHNENKLHYVLEFTGDEDRSQVHTGYGRCTMARVATSASSRSAPASGPASPALRRSPAGRPLPL